MIVIIVIIIVIVVIIVLFRKKPSSGIKYFAFKHIGNIISSGLVVSGLF